MLKGDLSAMSLATVLRDLADTSASGSLVLSHPDGDEAHIFMRSGLVCGLTASNRQSDLAAKLVSSGELAPEALAEALEAQRTDLAAWNLAELLIHLGYVERDVVQEFVTEQMHEALWDLMRWNEGRWKFRRNAKTREDMAAITVVELLESLRERGYEWESIAEVVDSPTAIPRLSARGDGAPETTLDSDAWSMLCKIDGVRSVAELATDCGYTLFEAGQVLVTLVDAGLVDVTEDGEYAEEDISGASALASALTGSAAASEPEPAEADDALSRLTRLAADVTNGVRAPAAASTNPLQLDVMAAQQGGPTNFTVGVKRRGGESFAASMDRVSDALTDALGPAPEVDDNINELLEVRKRPARAKAAPATDSDETETQRRKRSRSAAAAELADAAAAADLLRPDHDANGAGLESDSPLRLVDLETERSRVAANEAEEDSRHAAETAAREAAEQFAKAAAEQAARHAAEQAASTQTAAQVAAEQAAAAQLAADQAAAAQVAAEQAIAAQVAAEQAAAAQVAAQQAAAAQAAAEQAAAEQAAAEQAAAQLAAEQAAAQLAAQQAAAAQAAAAQAAAAQAAAEEAAAEAARLAQEEAELATVEAASEEAARLTPPVVERSDDSLTATAVLAELHHAAPAPTISVVPDPEPEPEPEPEPVYERDPAPASASTREGPDGADTAALLRELSSLGLEEEPTSLENAAPPPRQRPQQVDPKKAKKKIGLFGL